MQEPEDSQMDEIGLCVHGEPETLPYESSQLPFDLQDSQGQPPVEFALEFEATT